MTQENISHFFETLKQEIPVQAFESIYSHEVRFKDPFNEVLGIEAVHGIFAHMYQTLDNPRFVIKEFLEKKEPEKENIIYVQWDFIFQFKNEKEENSFEGLSRLEIDKNDKIITHTDYWDAAEHVYEKLPLLGSLLRFIKRKISIS